MPKPIIRYRDGATYWPAKGGMYARLRLNDGHQFNVHAIRQITFDGDGYPTRIETLNTIYIQVK